MSEPLIEELKALDRETLMERFASELPSICNKMGTTPSVIAWRTGLDDERVRFIISGKRKMKWSEYMSLLFVLWDDDRGREIVEKQGFFPEALKKVMSINRNDHGEVNGDI